MGTLFGGQEKTPIGIRGLHLDPCRHFISVETTLRIIEKMAALKLNTLHLHLSDDQGLPVEFASVPEIQSEQRWSITDQESIAAACKRHGIQVIPELDIPGHCRAFLSYLEDDVEIERQFGIITYETISIERHLPIIFKMFEELIERFDARMIHMGGDEAPGYKRYPELVERVCDWAKERNVEVIAWDDILTYIDRIPENCIIQRWRFRTSHKIKHARTILSWGYYLDHVDDPFTYYNREPFMWGKPLGCIACMWTELVTDRTIEQTIFPQMYMLAHRWWTYPYRAANQPALLRELCDTYGYPETEIDSWKMRRWRGFYKDDPRSTSSVTIDDILDREQDLYPVFSTSLIHVTDALLRWFHLDEFPTKDEVELTLSLGRSCYGEELSFLFEKPRGWKTRLRRLLKREETSLLYKNGLKIALRRALHGHYKPRRR